MAGSGLRPLLEKVCASNTVTYVLTGKAYERAVCGHLLVEAGLNTMLTATALGISSPTASQQQLHVASDQEPIDDVYTECDHSVSG